MEGKSILLNLFPFSEMPKSGLSAMERKERLVAYAEGHFKFSTGQRPTKGNRWWNELAKIDSCPRNSATHKDLFGRTRLCFCRYHKDTVLTTFNGSSLINVMS